jgi:hypothetical protein
MDDIRISRAGPSDLNHAWALRALQRQSSGNDIHELPVHPAVWHQPGLS